MVVPRETSNDASLSATSVECNLNVTAVSFIIYHFPFTKFILWYSSKGSAGFWLLISTLILTLAFIVGPSSTDSRYNENNLNSWHVSTLPPATISKSPNKNVGWQSIS